jgi:hypothetical protein
MDIIRVRLASCRRRQRRKVVNMSRLIRKWWQPRITGAQGATEIKVGLNRFAVRALEEASRCGAVNHADVMNRALLVYAALQKMTSPDDCGLKVVRGEEELWIGFI